MDNAIRIIQVVQDFFHQLYHKSSEFCWRASPNLGAFEYVKDSESQKCRFRLGRTWSDSHLAPAIQVPPLPVCLSVWRSVKAGKAIYTFHIFNPSWFFQLDEHILGDSFCIFAFSEFFFRIASVARARFVGYGPISGKAGVGQRP